MVAFPFGNNPPSLGGFIDEATKKYGAILVTLDNVTIRSAYGVIHPRVLERHVDGKDYHVILPTFPDDCLLTGHMVRNLCDRLAIPTTAFGFQLGDDGLVPLDSGDFH